jgi:hypothetical protein
MMIPTMQQFGESLETLSAHADEMISVFDLIEVLELRIRRIENHLGMPIPDDLVRVRTTEGRRK